MAGRPPEGGSHRPSADLAPAFKLVAQLHRDREAVAAFAGPHEGRWRNLFGLSGEQLLATAMDADLFATLEDRDLYVTLNGMRPASGQSRCRPFTNLPTGRRGSACVAALNAVWADLDCYAVKVSPAETLDALIAQRDRNQIPPWSFVIRSGRGLWVVWLLCDDQDPNQPAAATDENRDKCRRINRELATRFARLGADAKSTDLARVARVPGSRNSKVVGTHGIVRWEFGIPCPAYTVAELKAAFVTDSAPSPARRLPRVRRGLRRQGRVDRGAHRAKRAPRGKPLTREGAKLASRRRWSLPLWDILALAVLRSGFKPGHRHLALFWIAHLLNRAYPRMPGKRGEIRRICVEVNKFGELPLSEAEVERAVDRAAKWEPVGHVRNRYLADIFGVTPEEAKLLLRLAPETAKHRDARREAVRTACVAWIKAKGTSPTLDEVVRELTLAGCPASRATVARHLRALDYGKRGALRASPRSPSPLPPGTSAKNETIDRYKSKQRRLR